MNKQVSFGRRARIAPVPASAKRATFAVAFVASDEQVRGEWTGETVGAAARAAASRPANATGLVR